MELRGQVERMVALRDAFGRIEAFTDPLVRVMAVAPHCHDPRRMVQERAFEIVVGAGPSGSGYLRSLALDIGLPNLSLAPRAIRELSQAPSETLVPMLNEVLNAELQYWTSIEQPDSFWHSREPTRGVSDYRKSRYARLKAALRAPNGLSEQDLSLAFDAVSALQTVWGKRTEVQGLPMSPILELSQQILAKGER